MWIFYKWPIFKRVAFFIPQTLCKVNVIFIENRKKIFRPKKSMCLERVSHMKFSIKSAYGGQPQVMYICMDGNIEDGLKCIIVSSCGSKPWHAFELKMPLPRDAF